MSLRALPTSLASWHGKPVLVRVDWNIPVDGSADPESDLKIQRSLPLIHRLQDAGAKLVLVTHLGRPTAAREAALSTEKLLPFLQRQRLKVVFRKEDWTKKVERQTLKESIAQARPGTIFLLENIRFFSAEEKNTPAFAKMLAELGEMFVNEAFAVCHRAHASVVGIAKLLPSFAGPALLEEVKQLSAFRTAAKKPSIAFFGGKKISSKLPTLTALENKVDTLYLGGAMAVTCELALGKRVGASYIEPDQKVAARKLANHKRVRLPLDYLVAKELKDEAKTRISDLSDLADDEMVVDVGPQTLVMWANAIRAARSILWNGPMGINEIPRFAAGSRGLARFLGYIPHKAEVIVGGGDTIPVLGAAGVIDRITFVSTGGGAMLDFLCQGEALPGLTILRTTKK